MGGQDAGSAVSRISLSSAWRAVSGSSDVRFVFHDHYVQMIKGRGKSLVVIEVGLTCGEDVLEGASNWPSMLLSAPRALAYR